MSSSNNNKRGSRFDFTERDRQMFERSYLTLEMVKAQGWWRAAESINGADAIGHKPTALKDYNGIVIVYTHPITGQERERVLRLDNPERDTEGKEQGKYRGPIGRTNMFYVPVGVLVEWLRDISIPVIFVEGEKKCLAMWRIAHENMRDSKPLFIPIGLRGVWGWVGRTGNRDLPDGGHEREKGPLNDFDFLKWKGRIVYVLFDSNLHSPKEKTRESVRAARRGLSHHLHYILEAKAFFAEMTREHFEQGINGPDDLAGRQGPDAVLQLLDEAYLAVKPTKPIRERLSPEQREAQAQALRDMAGKSTDALAADVLGGKAAKHMLRLWAEAGLSDEAVRLLIAYEALAQGCDDLDYYYVDLYELLYKCDGTHLEETETGAQAVDASHLEQSPTGARVLKSSCRKKLAERIARAEAEFEQVGISFFYHTPGKLDEFDNVVQSNVKLYSRQFVAECLVLAESLPGYNRGKKIARNEAIRRFIAEKSGKAYRRKPPKKKDRSKQIADGWKRIQGIQQATIERMKARGDSDDLIAQTAIEFIDARIIDYIERRARGEVDAHFGVTSKQGANAADSTDDFAGFSRTCRNPQDKERDSELWDRFLARRQNGNNSPPRTGGSPAKGGVKDLGGVTFTLNADGSTLLSSNGGAGLSDERLAELWREQIGWVWTYLEQGKPLDEVLNALPPGEPPLDARWDYDALLSAIREKWPQAEASIPCQGERTAVS